MNFVEMVVALDTDRLRLGQGMDQCRAASALLTVTSASLSSFADTRVRELAVAALEAVARIDARLQLLGEAYRIAEEHQSGQPLVATPLPLSA